MGGGGGPTTPPLCAAGGSGLGPDTPKMLKLAEQCLERVKSLAAALGEPGGPGGAAGRWRGWLSPSCPPQAKPRGKRPRRSAAGGPLPSPGTAGSSRTKGASCRRSCRRRSSRSCRSPRRRQPASAWGWGRGGLAAGAAGSAFAQPRCWGPYGAALSRPRCLARVRGHPDAPTALDPRRELTPLEEASLQNQKLKAAYEARVARLNPSQAVQKTSLVSGELGVGAAGSWGRWDPHLGLLWGVTDAASLCRRCPCSGR